MAWIQNRLVQFTPGVGKHPFHTCVHEPAFTRKTRGLCSTYYYVENCWKDKTILSRFFFVSPEVLHNSLSLHLKLSSQDCQLFSTIFAPWLKWSLASSSSEWITANCERSPLDPSSWTPHHNPVQVLKPLCNQLSLWTDTSVVERHWFASRSRN